MSDGRDDTRDETLRAYLADARWFGGKGRDIARLDVRRIGVVAPAASEDDPTTTVDLVEVTFAGATGEEESADLYQLPLAHYPTPQERLGHALVGQWTDPDLGPSWVYDAVHDRAAMAAWLRAFADAATGPLRFHRLAGHDLDLDTHSTLFAGEQSNSSVVFGEDAVLKVFRRLTPGANPDIAMHEVLTAAGSDHVAALYGWLEADHEPTGEPLHLAMLQQFLRTGSDGWELALASVRNLFAEGDLHADEVGGDFAGEAGRLGVALGEVHAMLREHFPTDDLDPDRVATVVAAMQARLDQALRIVPALSAHEPTLRATFDALAGETVAAAGPLPVQRIHGDLHLGQTLRTVRGWKIVDFEGEPAAPLAERSLPDSPWRDVAGMLRSFDYAPAAVAEMVSPDHPLDDPDAAQRALRGEEWSARNQRAFVAAYAGRDLTTAEQAVLAAYIADKAVYECVYETRNRPGWVGIPLAAIARLGRDADRS